MKITRSIVLAGALVLAWATAGFAAPSAQDCAKRVDSFNYLVDYSGSMMMNHKQAGTEKLVIAQKVVTKVNAATPALDYQGGLYTFAPYGTVVKQGPWNRDALAKGVNSLKTNLDTFARFTPMGDGMMQHQAVIKSMAPKSAVIIVSDGENNRGSDPVADAKAIYAANPNVVFHIISVADTAEGQATLDNIARLNSNTVSVKALDLLKSDAAVDDFATKVFCEPIMDEVIVLRGVNFAFDSYQLDSKAQGVLNEAARIIKANNLKLRLLGWTDSIGTDAYNLVLSKNRANSVKTYLVEHGVNPANLVTEGMGKSYRYDNATEEGRYMNRRCELVSDSK